MENLIKDREPITTIAIHKKTKLMLDENKAPGQSYNGFVFQLVHMWKQNNGGGYSVSNKRSH